ncbi:MULTISPECIES: NUDIX hydrolase [unclassified Nonomuraea]|uniref:NUDIX hydrolase n=1 Tax=unclassified Nonomuraea TaxID=2593643 RepID=UPI0033D585F5
MSGSTGEWPAEPAWHLPGGAVEPGGTAAEAACREVREETGFVLAAADLAGPVAVNAGEWSVRGHRFHTVHTYFFARVPGTELPEPADDGLGHRWWTAGGRGRRGQRRLNARRVVCRRRLPAASHASTFRLTAPLVAR